MVFEQISTSDGWRLPRASMSASTAASVALHLALLFALFNWHAAVSETPSERSIAVDLISADVFEAATASPEILALPEDVAPAVAPEIVPDETVPVEDTQPAVSDMVQATHLYTAEILADPASKEVRDTLPLLVSDERVVQLCSIEALEQLPLWNDSLRPDILVAYASADMQISDHTLVADGGAFRSDEAWYAIRFRCAVADDFQAVTGFEFAVGQPIPADKWDEYNLPSGEGLD